MRTLAIYKRTRISKRKIHSILKLFALDLTAIQICELSGLNRNTILRYTKLFRQSIAKFCDQETQLSGNVEVDESYFGARRQKGKRGRGAYGKTIVFGIFKRNGKVYTEIVPNASKATLQAIIRGRVSLDTIIHSDKWRGYDGLVDVGYEKHLRVDHGKNEFANSKSHINGIEGFWGFAKNRLSKFKGIAPQTFYLHLKECEFRFNYRKHDLYKQLLSVIKS